MVVAIHQPNFLPWLGYFYKLARADVFVFLDSVAYSKNSFTNRNRVKTQTGVRWLTVPVRTSGKYIQSIADLLTSPDGDWRRKHLNALSAYYGRGEFFDEVFPMLQAQYRSVETETRLADFNIALVRTICGFLSISPDFVRSSELGVSGHATELLVNICQKLGATQYFAGGGALNYQESARFEKACIRVTISNFASCPYPQLWGSFVPGMSIVDALMNCGEKTRRILETSVQDTSKKLTVGS